MSRPWPWQQGRRGSGAAPPEDPAEQLDALVGPAAEPENAVLTDNARGGGAGR